MLRNLAAILTFFYCITAFSADITGKYRCTGEDFLNQSTFDEPTVLTKTGGTYTFEWLNHNLLFKGTAILLDKTLSAIFWAPSIPGSTPGIVTYKILPNGDLQGLWSVRGGEVIGKEYCKKLQ